VTAIAAPLRTLLATGRGRWIAAYLALQLAIPALYFVKRDPHDERFSWRMFSTMRMVTCEPELRVDDNAVILAAQFHEAWIELARRGRMRVLEAMAQRMCRLHLGHPVTMTLRCHYLDGSARTFGGHDACLTPAL
jgi:hypothetical protein